MQKKNFEELYEEFRKVLQEGDEQKAKDFLITHLNEFPKELQDKIILAFFMEGVEKAAEEAQLLNDFQAKTLKDIKEIEQTEQTLKDKLKLIEIQENLEQN